MARLLTATCLSMLVSNLSSSPRDWGLQGSQYETQPILRQVPRHCVEAATSLLTACASNSIADHGEALPSVARLCIFATMWVPLQHMRKRLHTCRLSSPKHVLGVQETAGKVASTRNCTHTYTYTNTYNYTCSLQ